MVREGFGKLISLSTAKELAVSGAPQLGTERVGLDDALGRVLAGPIAAPIDVPHFAKAAMDGFAVHAQDTFGASNESPVTLNLIGHVTPGRIFEKELQAGQCIEIATGAPQPAGTDATVMVENTETEGEKVLIYKPLAPGDNVIKIASDLAAGSRIFPKGRQLAPRHLGVLAAAGIREVEVIRKARIALISTGEELLEPGAPLAPNKIYNINSTTLRHSLRAFGCAVKDFGVVKDEGEDVKHAVSKALQDSDMVILSGGSSLGRGDFVPEIISEFGTLLFHGIAVKPGKPTALGTAGGKLIFGLPGYPTSALSNYYILIEPVLEKMTGCKAVRNCVTASMGRKVASTVGRYEFLAVKLDGGPPWRATPVMRGSSAITTLANADGFVEIEENIEVVEKGAVVTVRLF